MGKTKTSFVSDEEKNKKNVAKKKARKETKIHMSGLKGGQKVKVMEDEKVATEDTEKIESTASKNQSPRQEME